MVSGPRVRLSDPQNKQTVRGRHRPNQIAPDQKSPPELTIIPTHFHFHQSSVQGHARLCPRHVFFIPRHLFFSQPPLPHSHQTLAAAAAPHLLQMRRGALAAVPRFKEGKGAAHVKGTFSTDTARTSSAHPSPPRYCKDTFSTATARMPSPHPSPPRHCDDTFSTTATSSTCKNPSATALGATARAPPPPRTSTMPAKGGPKKILQGPLMAGLCSCSLWTSGRSRIGSGGLIFFFLFFLLLSPQK